MRLLAGCMIALMASGAQAQEVTQLSAHEHGVGSLDISIEQDLVAMQFRAPGADIVGFEYDAETAQDRQAVADALALLEQPLALFGLPAAAGCTVVQAHAALASDHAMHGDGSGHVTHEEKHAAHEDGHTEHDEHAANEEHEDHHDDDDHEDHGKAENSHAEYEADYELKCADATAITSLALTYFDVFPNAEELEIQVISEMGAQAVEALRARPLIELDIR